MKLTIAEKMFNGVLDDLGDKNLDQMYNVIKEMKEKYYTSFRSYIKTPFIKELFEMIEDEYEYRHCMDEEMSDVVRKELVD